MTLVRYDVHDPAGGLLGTLTEPHSDGMVVDLTSRVVGGSLQFTVDLASTADQTLLADRRRVRVMLSDDGQAWTAAETFVIVDLSADLRTTGDGEIPTTRVTCQHATQALGGVRGGGVLYPEGGVDGRYARNPRPFGWMARTFDDSGWTSPAPYSGGQQRRPRFASKRGLPEGWPVPHAEWVGPRPLGTYDGKPNSHPYGLWYLRHRLQGQAQTATLFITADDEFVAYLNGAPLTSGDDWRRVWRTDVDLTGNDVLAVQVRNRGHSATTNPSELLYVIVGHDGEGNPDPDRVLYASTSGATFTEARNEVQSIVLDVDHPPFPWGPDYPSTGPEQLQGTWRLVYGSQTSTAIQWDAGASAVKAAIDGMIDGTVTVTGSGTSGSPWLVTFDGGAASGKPHPLMGIIHTDLRHNHATTRVRKTTVGRQEDTSLPGAENIRIWDFGLGTPGVTVGWIMDLATSESQSAGELGWLSWTFDDVNGTDLVPWQRKVSHQFRLQELGRLLEELCQFEGEARVEPDGTLRFQRRLGTDLTATVTVSDPFGLARTGEGRRASRFLYETPGGFATANIPAAEPMAKVVSYGTGLEPEDLAEMVADQLAEEHEPTPEFDVDLPDDVQPYRDVQLGDSVTLDGYGPVRLVELAMIRDGDQIEWAARAVAL